MLRTTTLSLAVLGSFATAAQTTYTQTLPTMNGAYSWYDFYFTACPPTTGTGTIGFSWACCWMSGFGGNSVYVQFETSNGWEQVYTQGGNVSECTYLPASGIVDATILSDAIDFGGGTIHGRVYATDNCVAGWGCVGFSDPSIAGMTLTYDAHAADFSANDQAICPGATVQFTDESINTPSSYEWIFPGGTPSGSSIQNPVVQYATPGSYDVTLIVTTVDGPDTLVRPGYITVHAPPPANAGVDEDLCLGASTQLQAGGGVSYQWFPPDDLSDPNIDDPLAAPTSTTSYTVLVTDANGCQASDYMILTVHPLPTVVASAGNNTICLGDTAYIVAVGAQLYQWSPNLFISGIAGAAQYAWPTSTFAWTVTGTDMHGCVSDTTVTITVQPPPPAPTVTQNGAELQSSAGSTYQWFLNGVLLPGETGSTLLPAQNGNYSVMITDASGCGAMSLPFYMGNVGVPAAGSTPFGLFPSPADDRIVLSGPALPVQWWLHDPLGRLISSGTATDGLRSIPLAGLDAGRYVVLVRWRDGEARLPFVKR